jgi:hypothetical protein
MVVMILISIKLTIMILIGTQELSIITSEIKISSMYVNFGGNL